MPYKYSKSKPSQDRENILHVHAFFTMADVADCHQHGILGVSGPEIEKGRSHVHCIRVYTTFDPREEYPPHWHGVDVMTGPALDLPGGLHTHHFAGETTCDLGHKHCFNSVTDTAPESEDDECDDDYRPKTEE